jgi:hypothetical protein
MKLLDIAYVDDPNSNTFIAFKCEDNKDVFLAEFKEETKLHHWLNDMFIPVMTKEDYTTVRPSRYLNSNPKLS